ncbi:MAG: ribosome biogenesis GTP-binding protein YihA/YsxC [Candidatus Nitricoxidivorans perseverans]|uniref:Probable GTP-binding protein EngB n=1 Tax=Candidatus Nitricoxidivorans perseverans TaxID=2975601 RepID=A0AA49FJD8_9PROT|nr:MAG: ribosome biogenesis GTP-binding protein YihA/YsxC [Candidatus Nitricoxidivorans perseverans]
MPIFHHATFEISVAKPQDLPQATGPEIAFAGRSNAGKSSAINTLARHTRLAFVSKTPGRTQLINLFRLRNGAALVDLPGYGYADVPLAVRRQWQGLLEHYLTERQALVGLVLIMDARRPLTDLDRQMINWFGPTGKPIHCLLTKADKLTKSEQAKVLREVRTELEEAGSPMTAQLFSSLKKTGMEEAEMAIGDWLAKKEAPGQRGEAGGQCLNGIKAPAQGG